MAKHFKKGELEKLCSLDFHFKEVNIRGSGAGIEREQRAGNDGQKNSGKMPTAKWGKIFHKRGGGGWLKMKQFVIAERKRVLMKRSLSHGCVDLQSRHELAEG